MTTQEAIESLENIIEYWTCRPTEVESAKLAIAALEESKSDAWIPVTERLPNNKERVLIQTSSGVTKIAFCNINYSEWREDGYKIASPVAWKPLPTPYKEES